MLFSRVLISVFPPTLSEPLILASLTKTPISMLGIRIAVLQKGLLKVWIDNFSELTE